MYLKFSVATAPQKVKDKSTGHALGATYLLSPPAEELYLPIRLKEKMKTAMPRDTWELRN